MISPSATDDVIAHVPFKNTYINPVLCVQRGKGTCQPVANILSLIIQNFPCEVKKSHLGGKKIKNFVKVQIKQFKNKKCFITMLSYNEMQLTRKNASSSPHDSVASYRTLEQIPVRPGECQTGRGTSMGLQVLPAYSTDIQKEKRVKNRGGCA